MPKPPLAKLLRPLVLLHVLGLAFFLGGTAGVLIAGFAGERDGGLHRGFALEIALELQDLVLLPGAVAIVVSGVALSLIGPFGFVRHWWMVAKLVGSVVLAFHSQVEYRPLTGRLLDAVLAASPGAAPDGWADLWFHYQRVGVIQIVVLVLLSALGVLKPWGRTPLGRRATTSRSAPDEP